MKKTIFLLSLLLMSALNAQEVKWSTLQGLVVPTDDERQKGKKAIPSADVQKVINKDVVMRGFMMPLDYTEKEVTEFLFMPYIPSCYHVPPPPSNQMIVVKTAAGLKAKSTFSPVELVGKLELDENVDFESSYKMTVSKYTVIDPTKMSENEKKSLQESAPAQHDESMPFPPTPNQPRP